MRTRARLNAAASTLVWILALAAAELVAPTRSPGQSPDCVFAAASRVRLSAGTTSAAHVSANHADGRVRVSRDVVMADETTITGARVELAAGADVFDVVAADLYADCEARIRGSVATEVFPLTETYCAIAVPDTCDAPDVAVAKGQVVGPLAPGSYGRLRIRSDGELTLAGGSFQFCGISVGNGAALRISEAAEVTLAVVGDLKIGKGGFLGPQGGGPLPLLELAGRGVRVRGDGELAAIVRAPQSRLRTATGAQLRGSVCAESLTIGKTGSLVCASARCGNGILEQASEECDGADDAACPGACRIDCLCGDAWHFTEVTTDAGIDARYEADYSGRSALELEILVISGGVAAGDYDGDGWVDLYTVGGELGQDRLYRNRGDGTFEDMAGIAGVSQVGVRSNSPTFADYDGDGRLDLFVGGQLASANKLFRNNGDGTFADVAAYQPFSLTFATFGSALGDYDGDGDLDLFSAHWGSNAVVSPPIEHLWRNEGDGTFTPATAAAGLDLFNPDHFGFTWTFTPNFSDVNGDGRLDLLVASDFGTEQYFLNDGDGTFTEATGPVNTSENGMGSAIGDYDNDGDLDWFISSVYDPNGVAEGNWGVTGNRMYRNRGDGSFEDVTDLVGVRVGYWGWGACFADFNLDGRLDLFHVNGFDAGAQETAEFHADPSPLYIADGSGGFVERSLELGLVDVGAGRGVACFDYDRDGDVDIFVANGEGQPARLYRNDGNTHGNFLQVRLDGRAPNSEGIGAKVYARSGSVTQLREIRAGNNFSSQDPAVAHFGVGAATVIDELRLVWPDGTETTLTGVGVNQFLTIAQP